MTKQEFLTELRRALTGLPQDDIDERVSFYAEMIDDRVEEGMTEEEAVEKIGPIADIVSQTVSDVPLTKIVKERVKPKRALRAWEIALIILGFPIWFPLLVAAAAITFSVYVVIWSLIISLWAVELSFAASAVGGSVAAAFLFTQGAALPGIASLGLSLLCAGVAVFLFFACVAASKGVVRLTKKMFLGLKTAFIGKESEK